MIDPIEFAKKNGYETAKYAGTWKDYKVFDAIYKSSGGCIGKPRMILVKGKEMRFTLPEEAMIVYRHVLRNQK